MYKKFKELFLNNVHLTMKEQKQLLDTTFENWKEGIEQVDDVCVVGVRI